MKDPRAPVWHAMKFTAALQAATRCALPIVLQAATVGGHFGEPGSNAGANALLDYLTFLVKQRGIAPPS